MTCEEARALRPEMAEGAIRPAGEAEAHLAGCAACSAELARYRALLVGLDALKEVLDEPSEGFLERLLAQVPESQRARLIHRFAQDERLHHAAFSIGGVVVGATAIALLWWRAAHRGVAGDGGDLHRAAG